MTFELVGGPHDGFTFPSCLTALLALRRSSRTRMLPSENSRRKSTEERSCRQVPLQNRHRIPSTSLVGYQAEKFQ
jgi:hypothetical protein